MVGEREQRGPQLLDFDSHLDGTEGVQGAGPKLSPPHSQGAPEPQAAKVREQEGSSFPGFQQVLSSLLIPLGLWIEMLAKAQL